MKLGDILKEAVSPAQQAAIAIDMKKRGIKPKNVQEWFESNRTRASYQLRHGDNWWWKLNEVHDAMLEKIGADCCDDCGEELNEQPEHEITVGNYTTKFFYMCGSAQKVMDANKTTIGAESLTRLQDDFYKLEKQVMDAGEATNEQKVMAKELYNQIIKESCNQYMQNQQSH